MKRILRRILSYCNDYICRVRWIKGLIGPALLTLIISNYLELRCSFLSGELTSDINDKQKSEWILKQYILYFVVGYTLKYLVNLFNAHFIAVSMRSGFRNFFYEYLAIKYKRFQEIGIGEAHYNISRRAGALADFLTALTMSFVSNFFFFILAIQTASSYVETSIKIRILAAIVAFLLLSLLLQYFRSKIRRCVNKGLERNSRHLYDVLFNYERIVAYETLDVELKKYWDSMNDQTYYAVIYWVSYEVINYLNAAVFLLMNIYLIAKINGTQSIKQRELKGFILVITKLREKVLDISRNVDELFTTFTNLDQSQIVNDKLDEQPGLCPVLTYNDRIEGRNLSFRFGENTILKGVNFNISKGEKIAIAGENGNGKSTFAKILLSFYDYEGSLMIDGREYSTLSRRALRDTIGYIPQTSQLFAATILENLSAGRESVDFEKVVEFCKIYGAHELFRSLGYNKDVGERGKNLSGGQRQKICFMRAVIRNTPVLIMDEATANMDVQSEKKIIKQMRENMKNKTVVMIIHNLSLLKHFDRVFFFKNATLRYQGAFRELYEKYPDFRQFYDKSTQKALPT